MTVCRMTRWIGRTNTSRAAARRDRQSATRRAARERGGESRQEEDEKTRSDSGREKGRRGGRGKKEAETGSERHEGEGGAGGGERAREARAGRGGAGGGGRTHRSARAKARKNGTTGEKQKGKRAAGEAPAKRRRTGPRGGEERPEHGTREANGPRHHRGSRPGTPAVASRNHSHPQEPAHAGRKTRPDTLRKGAPKKSAGGNRAPQAHTRQDARTNIQGLERQRAGEPETGRPGRRGSKVIYRFARLDLRIGNGLCFIGRKRI